MAFDLPTFPALHPSQAAFLAQRWERVRALHPAYEDLRAKLLRIGGLEVVLPPYDQMSEPERDRQRYETEQLLRRGQSWPPAGARLARMDTSNCHQNAAVLHRAGHGTIVTGFALSADGLWREHSWLIGRSAHGEQLVETAVERLLYHGYVLSQAKQRSFVRNELGPDGDEDGGEVRMP